MYVVCPELIEETGGQSGVIFGHTGLFLAWLGQVSVTFPAFWKITLLTIEQPVLMLVGWKFSQLTLKMLHVVTSWFPKKWWVITWLWLDNYCTKILYSQISRFYYNYSLNGARSPEINVQQLHSCFCVTIWCHLMHGIDNGL